MSDGLFDMEFRHRELDKNGDPLVFLAKKVDWEMFRPQLETIRPAERKSNAGRPPFDAVLMFKILVLQSLYNLSDDATEYQVRDRLSFMRFLGLDLSSRVPDAKTIWLFREKLKEAGLAERLFDRFDSFLRGAGFAARKGQIVDASIVSAPVQRNTRRENESIKAGERPAGWSDAKGRQKDTDARWTKKHAKSYFGYKNHVCADVEYKFVRAYDVTAASVHDSNVCEDLLDPGNSSADVWMDSAYASAARERDLREGGYRPHIQRKGARGRKLTLAEKRGNRTRARVRARVEHIFGVQAKRAGDLVVRTIGLARARTKIGLRNLTYNIARYAILSPA